MEKQTQELQERKAAIEKKERDLQTQAELLDKKMREFKAKVRPSFLQCSNYLHIRKIPKGGQKHVGRHLGGGGGGVHMVSNIQF